MDNGVLIQRIEVMEATMKLLLEDLTNIKNEIKSECIHTPISDHKAAVRAEVRMNYLKRLDKKKAS